MKTNWTNLGCAAHESVAMREDFKVVRIGKDFQAMSKSSVDELSNASYGELLGLCIRLFNEEDLASNSLAD